MVKIQLDKRCTTVRKGGIIHTRGRPNEKFIKKGIIMRLIRAKDYADVSRKAANIIASRLVMTSSCSMVA